MKESWVNNGKTVSRANRITVEVLGRDAQRIVDEGKVGMWVTIEGYIRSEEYQGRTIIKVRTLNIDVWELYGEEKVRSSGEPAGPDVSKVQGKRRLSVEDSFARGQGIRGEE
jgi:hypothetical protein